MTHHVFFNASQVFLSFVKKSLDSEQWSFESGVLCTISCAAAIEAIVNEILQEDGRIKGWDQLNIKSKIDNIGGLNNQEIEWGSNHWQTVDCIIKARNYLVHFKGENMGLFGTPHIEEMSINWIIMKQKDRKINSPSIKFDFSKEAVARYYNSLLISFLELTKHIKDADRRYNFLSSEDYSSFTIY